MKEITRFINEELKPRLYGFVPYVFPDLHFTKKGNKWISPLHYDGSEGTDKRPDRSQVTEKYPTRVWDNSRQKGEEIIDLFMEKNGLEFWEAVKRLCSIVGIEEPKQKELTPEQRERYAEFEKRRELLEESVKRQGLALYQPKDNPSAQVRDYVYSRGFKEWDLYDNIMQGNALLGYINEEEATTLRNEGFAIPSGVGTAFTLSIPVYSGGILWGIKFRNIKATKANGLQRYTSFPLPGGEKKLHNLTGIKRATGSVVVVESELDVLIAEYNGLNGFVATGGGKLEEELLDEVRNRGIKRITLLLDSDKAGADFVRNSIKIAHRKGVSILVATIPEGEKTPKGEPVHDVGEYLQIHTIKELQDLIEHAESGSMWLLEDIVFSYTQGNETITAPVKIDLLNAVISLGNNDTPNEIERQEVFSAYANFFNIDKKQVFSAEVLRKVADEERLKQDTITIREETKKALKEATALAEKGGTQAALRIMEEAIAKAKQTGDREKYGDLLRIPTREERIKRFKEKPESLETSYQFNYGGTDPVLLTLPSGAVTILGALTGHGKSLFLRNLAIDVAKRYEDKRVLYFTFEECEEDVWAQFTNTYVNMQLHEVSKRHDQVETISNYYKTGDTGYISFNKREEFKRKEMEFSSSYLDNGKITIIYKEYDLETLIDALEFAVSHIPTKAIFIDYVQILRSQKMARQTRADQLKEICISLKNFAVEHKLPIVVAAQLNRGVENLFKMDNQNIAESSDIEKAANTIIMLWNSNKYVSKDSLNKDEKKALEEIEDNGFTNGKEGRIFMKLTKRRGRGVGMYGILKHTGYSGRLEMFNKDGVQDIPF